MTTAATAGEDGSAEPSATAQAPVAGPFEAPAPAQAPAGIDGQPAAPVAEPPEGSAESPDSDAAALSRVLKIFGSVVAPATFLTALMYYFGRLEYAGLFSYVGADVTVLDLTFQDYLNNSVSGFTPPLIVVAVVTLLALWAHQLLRALPAGIRRIVWQALLPAATISGFILVSLALADLFVVPVFPVSFLEGRGLSLSVGILLLAYAARLFRLLRGERNPKRVPRRAPGAVSMVEWGAAFILVSVGLFWAAGSYAIGVGMRYAQQLETALWSRPDVVAFSEKRLSLHGPGLREVNCQDPDAAYRFRYDGLKLMLQSGNQYLLLPAGWTHTNGAAILIPRSDKIRLEFTPPGQLRNATC